MLQPARRSNAGVYVVAPVAATTLLAFAAAFTPVWVAGVLAAGVAAAIFWALPRKAAAMTAAGGALLVLAAVPILRIHEHDTLQVAIPVLVLVLAGIAATREGVPRGLAKPAALLVLLLALEAAATARVEDDNEWAALAVTAAVAVTGLGFGAVAVVRGAWPRLRALLVWAALAEAAFAVVEVFYLSAPLWRGATILPTGHSIPLRSQLLEGLPRAQGTFGHPLPLAFFLLVALAFVLRDQTFRRGRWLATVVLLAGIAASGSRNALLFAAILLVLKGGRSSLVVRAPLLIGLVAGVALLAMPKLAPAMDEFAGTGSFTHRAGAVESVGRLMDRDLFPVLFGDGASSTPRLFRQGLLQSDGLLAVDNQVVLTVAQNGLVGLAVLAVLLVGAVRRARAGVRVALIVAVGQFAVFDVLTWPASAFLVWLLVGAAFAGRADDGPGLADGVVRAERVPAGQVA